MPDPLLYLQTMAASAGVSALLALAIGWARGPASAARLNTACVVAIGGGVAIGLYVLRLRLTWPPANGLDRFVTIVLPAALVIEWICGFGISGWQSAPRWLAWLLRISLVMVIGRILLHGSVYISGPEMEWTVLQTAAVLAACGALTATLWTLLSELSVRSPGISLPLALALSIQSAGAAVMLAGYVTGGAASLPLTGALVGSTIAMRRISATPDTQAIVGIGVVGLFGLLFIGLFFGRLSTASALAMLLAPLLCWTTELPTLRRQPPWLVGSLRLLLVAIPLVIVLGLAMHDFQRHTAPLLGR